MKIVIFVASKKEINIDKLKIHIKDIDLKIKCTGIGIKRKEDLKSFIEQGNFSLVINAGTAGIISSKIKVFDIILPSIFYNIDNNRIINYDSLFIKKLNKNWRRAAIISSDNPVTSAQQKIDIQKKFPNVEIVDMESYHIAEICKKLGYPFISIKIATDYADTDTENIFYNKLQRAGEILSDAIIELINNFTKYG